MVKCIGMNVPVDWIWDDEEEWACEALVLIRCWDGCKQSYSSLGLVS